MATTELPTAGVEHHSAAALHQLKASLALMQDDPRHAAGGADRCDR